MDLLTQARKSDNCQPTTNGDKLLARLSTFKGKLVHLKVVVDESGQVVLWTVEEAGRVEGSKAVMKGGDVGR